MREDILTEHEHNFVSKLLKSNLRVDGRKIDEFRNVKISFGSSWGSAVVSIGRTKVLVQASCELGIPKATRPNEGVLYMNIELGPMAAPHFEVGRSGELGIQINRALERTFKDSRAIDLESLCIKAEECVWILRVDVNVLNHDGNLIGCCAIAIVTALTHFRRPDVSIIDGDVYIHPPSEKDYIPMVLHHYPICVSYGIFDNGRIIVADPTDLEERAAQSELVFGINSYREVCCLNLGGTAQVNQQSLVKCVRKAADQSMAVIEKIKKSVEDDVARRNNNEIVTFSDTLNLQNKLTKEHIKLVLQDEWLLKLNKMQTDSTDESSDELDENTAVEESDDKNAERVTSLGSTTAILDSNQSDIQWIPAEDTEVSDKEESTTEKPEKSKKEYVLKGNDTSDSEEDEIIIL